MKKPYKTIQRGEVNIYKVLIIFFNPFLTVSILLEQAAN
jgi:VIT1/CCC1 family predicted Fe2+/Mn2+ transporter